MRSLSRILGACVLAVTMTTAGLAFGGDTLTAEALFRQGLESMKKNQFKEACEAFGGSNEADPSPGTEINLALCNEKLGKIATAWGWYRTAAGLADQRGQKERADLARAEAAKLEPKLHKLVLTIKVPAEGLVVTRNGQTIPNASLGSGLPIDPGDYKIEANAKGKQPFKQTIHIADGPGSTPFEIPGLEDAPVEAKPPGPNGPDYVPPAPGGGGGSQRTIAFVAGGTGIVAGVVAIIVEVVALKEQDKSKSQAEAATKITGTTTNDVDNRKNLQDSATSHHSAAKTDEAIAIVSGIGGVVLIGVGVTLLLTAPSAKSSGSLSHPLVVPLVGRDNAGLGLVGRF
jgi:hypothetical protein